MYFTFCKNNIVIAALVAANVFFGCARKNVIQESEMTRISPLDQARLDYEHGEYFKARTQVQTILNNDPENTAAQQLMADVLDKEIARQKEEVVALQSGKSTDEESEQDKNAAEVKTWLERSRSLFRDRQYDLALFAAEKVFIYDADNREASLLIDDIKEAAMKEGKADSLFLSKMYQDEISERVQKYRAEAQEFAGQQKNEQALFTLQKILMLEPEDPEALQLFRDIQKKESQKA